MEERFETFTVLINRISRNIRKIKNREMAAYGLKGAQISCLYYLYCTPGLTATELCERCEEDKATISRTLNALEEEGYLNCRIDQGKRYKSPILLTEQGREMGARIAGKIRRVLEEISGTMTPEGRAAFYACLSVVSESLEAVAENKGSVDE